MLNNVLVRIKPFLSFESLHCWSILAFLCRHPRGSCLWQNESLQQQYSDNGAVSTPVSLSLRAQRPLFSFSRSRDVYSPWVQSCLQPFFSTCASLKLDMSCRPSRSMLIFHFLTKKSKTFPNLAATQSRKHCFEIYAFDSRGVMCCM